MRTMLWTLLVGVLIASAGCTALDKAIEGYYFKPTHFQFGTVKERDFGKSVEKMYATTQQVLKERDFSIRKAEIPNKEEAQIWASKGGIDYVFDITAAGDGCKVHLEVDQAGNDADAWAVLNMMEQYP